MFADAHRPEVTKAFEMQGRVTRVRLEEGKVLVTALGLR
jgi:hypothetical protein